MTISERETLDFTMMYATHDAFRRDLNRLESAVGKAGTPLVRAGWENFKTQLLIHHSVEDTDLWPRVLHSAAGRPRDLALLADMEAEHARLDPLLAAVDEALTGGAATLADHLHEVSKVLGDHLTHEEDSALPLMQSVLPPGDWDRFSTAMARRQGVRGAARYVPWVLDGRPPADQQRVLALLPAPVRLINRLVWQPRYQRRSPWNVGTAHSAPHGGGRA